MDDFMHSMRTKTEISTDFQSQIKKELTVSTFYRSYFLIENYYFHVLFRIVNKNKSFKYCIKLKNLINSDSTYYLNIE